MEKSTSAKASIVDQKRQVAGIDCVHFNNDYRLEYYRQTLTEAFAELGLGTPEFANLENERLMSAILAGRYMASQHQHMYRRSGGTFSGALCFELLIETLDSRHPEFCSMLEHRLQGQTVLDLGFLPQYCAHLKGLNERYNIQQLVGVGYHMEHPLTLKSNIQGFANVTAIDLEAVEFMALLPKASISALCMFAVDATMFDLQQSGRIQSQVWIEQIDRILKPGAILFGYDAKPIEDLLAAKPLKYKLLNKLPRNASYPDSTDLFYFRSASSPLIFLEKK